jgi:hypothetical protein
VLTNHLVLRLGKRFGLLKTASSTLCAQWTPLTDQFFPAQRLAAMDYQTFEKAMDRAGKALFIDNDTERCMNILQSVMRKFESVR